MPETLLTQNGYDNILTALTSTPILIPTFKVGDSIGYSPHHLDTDIRGTLLYEGGISSSYMLNKDTVVFVCSIPSTSIAGDVGELGLFLADTTMLSLGVFEKAIPKSSPYILKVYAYVQCKDLADAIDTNYLVSKIIPKVVDYETTPLPNCSEHNACIALNGHGASPNQAPTMLVKQNLVGDRSKWLGVNASKLYEGTVNSGTTTTFILDPVGSNSEQYVDGEGLDYGFMHVVFGNNVGATRGITYDPTTLIFTIVGTAFATALDTENIISVWAFSGSVGGKNNNNCNPTINLPDLDAAQVDTLEVVVPTTVCTSAAKVVRVAT